MTNAETRPRLPGTPFWNWFAAMAAARIHRAMAVAAPLLLAACGLPALPACEEATPPLRAWIVDYGWHTEIVLPAAQLAGPLAPFRTLFPAARTISFGFGKASFFTVRDPGFGDYAAGIIPGPADMRVIPLRDDPQNLYASPVARIPLTSAEWPQLERFIAASFARTSAGALIPVSANDGTGGRFFAAVAGYSLAYTCNAWTVDALHQSGLHVELGAVLASGVMRQVAHIRASCAPR